MITVTAKPSESAPPAYHGVSFELIPAPRFSASSISQACQKPASDGSPVLYLEGRLAYPESASEPILHFGFGYTKENILYCARKRQLLAPEYYEEQDDEEKEDCRLFIIMMQVKQYLERKLKIHLEIPLAINPGYMGVFSLYSNHTRHRRYRPKREGEILNTLRRELDVRRQAIW